MQPLWAFLMWDEMEQMDFLDLCEDPVTTGEFDLINTAEEESVDDQEAF